MYIYRHIICLKGKRKSRNLRSSGKDSKSQRKNSENRKKIQSTIITENACLCSRRHLKNVVLKSIVEQEGLFLLEYKSFYVEKTKIFPDFTLFDEKN